MAGRAVALEGVVVGGVGFWLMQHLVNSMVFRVSPIIIHASFKWRGLFAAKNACGFLAAKNFARSFHLCLLFIGKIESFVVWILCFVLLL